MKNHSITQAEIKMQRVFMIALALTLGWFWIYVHCIEPAPFYMKDYDPEMPYMLSSLSVFKGYPYIYTDHPGTPVEMLGTALLGLTYPIIKKVASDSFVMYHIMHPEVFLALGRGFLTVASIMCVVLLARYAIPIKHWTDAVYSIAVAASFYAVHPLAFNSLVLWSHNSFNFPAGTLLLLGLLTTFRYGRPLCWWKIAAFGFAAGVLTSVQLYFTTWIIGLAVAVVMLNLFQKRGWLQTIYACFNVGLASLLGFVMATLPIIEHYPRLIRWVRNLLWYQGRYGFGSPGITSANQFSLNFMQLWSQLPFLFIAVFLVMIMLGLAMFLQRRYLKQNPELLAVACGLLVQLIVTMAVIIKHPGEIYMLAVAAIFPLLLAMVFALLPSYGLTPRIFCVGLSILVLIGFLHNLTNSISNHHISISMIQKSEREIEHYFADYAASIGQDPDSLLTLWTYGTESGCYALWFGNEYASRAFMQEISQVCPNQGNISIWGSGRIQLPDRSLNSSSPKAIIVTLQKFLKRLESLYPFLANLDKPDFSTARSNIYDSNIVFIPLSHTATVFLYMKPQANPDNACLVTVDPSLKDVVSINALIQRPSNWSIEVSGNKSWLWLGHGGKEGVGGVLWSDAVERVVFKFNVAPGPAREDRQRTVEFSVDNLVGLRAKRQSFDKPSTLSFEVELQPGRNEFIFKILDQATILKQPNGDTRPLLVRLCHINVTPVFDGILSMVDEQSH